MSHIIHNTVLGDGTKDATVHIYFESDGVSPDLTNQVIINPTNLYFVYPYNNDNPNQQDIMYQPPMPLYRRITVNKIWAEVQDFTATLAFANNDIQMQQRIWTLTPGTRQTVDFSWFGGIQDKSQLQDILSKIVVTTQGLTTPRSRGSIIVNFRKSYHKLGV